MRRNRAIKVIRGICREIGCSGLDPKMCKQEPQNCTIIRRLMRLTLRRLVGGDAAPAEQERTAGSGQE